MSSILTSQSVVFATAMAAVSGTVILLAAIRHQKTHQPPPPCLISSADDVNQRLKNRKKTKKKIKRVRFSDDVVEPRGDGVEFRKRRHKKPSSDLNSNCFNDAGKKGIRITGMPANRVALYNGMIRDRVGHRLAYSSY